MRLRGAICAVLVFVGVMALTSTAHAAFPGQNGKIAFARPAAGKGTIWTINPDGTGAAHLPNTSVGRITPAWSPSGTRIAYDAGAILGVDDADGSNDQFWYDHGESMYFIDWSPDETSITFVDGPNSQGFSALWKIVAQPDSFPTVIKGNVGFGGVAWSPDGTRIAFQDAFPSPNGIYTILPDGSGQALVPGTSSVALEGGLDWSPDAGRLAFAGEQDGIRGIFTIDVDGTDLTRVTSAPADLRDTAPAWSPDGTRIAFIRWGTASAPADTPRQLFVVDSDGGSRTQLAAAGDLVLPYQLDWQPIPINAYPRPKGATPFLASLVPAYTQCPSPNRTHGPPLSFGSCHPPLQSSDELTVGSADSNGKPTRSISSIRFQTLPGVPSTPADEADVRLEASITDVYTQGALEEYSGELRAQTSLRITDKSNTPHPGGPGAATVADLAFGFTIPCEPTPDPDSGSACTLETSAEALYPGALTEGRRAIWQLGQLVVYDGGADDDGDTAADNTLFMKQGIFVP